MTRKQLKISATKFSRKIYHVVRSYKHTQMATSSSFNSHFQELLNDPSQLQSQKTSEDISDDIEQSLQGIEPLSHEEILHLLQESWDGSASRKSQPSRSAPTLDWLQKSVYRLFGSPQQAQAMYRSIPGEIPLDSVTSLLSASQRSNDDISSDLLDLLGFEAFDLIAQILDKRSAVQIELQSRDADVSGVNLHLPRCHADARPYSLLSPYNVSIWTASTAQPVK